MEAIVAAAGPISLAHGRSLGARRGNAARAPAAKSFDRRDGRGALCGAAGRRKGPGARDGLNASEIWPRCLHGEHLGPAGRLCRDLSRGGARLRRLSLRRRHGRAGRAGDVQPAQAHRPFGTMLLPALLILIALSASCSATPSRCRSISAGCNHPRRDMVLVALAGPVDQCAAGDRLALLFYAGRLACRRARPRMGGDSTWQFARINAVLCVFNMLPLAAARRRPGRGRDPARCARVAPCPVERLRHADPDAVLCLSFPMSACASGSISTSSAG